MAHAGGRPPFYKTVEEMQIVIDKYFEDCEGKVLTIPDAETGEDKPVLDKYGHPVIVGAKPPTVTGLALALGFNSRQALLNYQGKPEFNDAITRAKLRCQEYAESRLFDKDGANGAKFTLQNNFGWVDESKVNTTIANAEGESLRIESVADADKIIAEYLSKQSK